MMRTILALALVQVVVCDTGASGVDVSTPVSVDNANCFVQENINTIIARAWRSTGDIDTAACDTLVHAADAGIAQRDVYFFPCVTCSTSPASQMWTMVSYLKSNCGFAWSGKVWLDIEGSQYWLGDSGANREWYQKSVDACNSLADSCGVYSSNYQWESIFGSGDYAYGSYLPLWYAHYDNTASYDDFTPFGNWSKPAMKQFEGDASLCKMNVDLNYIK